MLIRDLPVFDRRVRLVWSRRRFSCLERECPQRTWTEHSEELPDRRLLSARAARECTRAVGEEARSIASLARWLGVSWATVMTAVRDYGTPLVDDPARVEEVSSLGIDETAFLKANPEHPTMYVTGLVDLERRVLIDMIEGNRAIDVSRWLSRREEAFLAGIVTVACDLHEGYRSGLHRAADSHSCSFSRSSPTSLAARKRQNETSGTTESSAKPKARSPPLVVSSWSTLPWRMSARHMPSFGSSQTRPSVPGGSPHREYRSTPLTSTTPRGLPTVWCRWRKITWGSLIPRLPCPTRRRGGKSGSSYAPTFRIRRRSLPRPRVHWLVRPRTSRAASTADAQSRVRPRFDADAKVSRSIWLSHLVRVAS